MGKSLFKLLMTFVISMQFLPNGRGQVTVNGKPYAASRIDLSVAPNVGQLKAKIPVVKAPGNRAGFVLPETALVYSSGAGPDVAGNWGLDVGYPLVVSRTGPTRADEDDVVGKNQASSVNPTFTKNDRFIWSGKRLELTPESILPNRPVNDNYHELNVSYYPELFDGSRVRRAGDFMGQPLSFIVQRQGLTYYYGGQETFIVRLAYGVGNDAVASTKVLHWLLRRVEDAFGNYVSFTWDRQVVGNETAFLLESMNYLGNDRVSPALPPTSKVAFYYETRYDQIETFVDGAFVRNTKRLSQIRVYQGTHRYRYIDLKYDNSTEVSLLSQVQEFAEDSPLKPIKLTYGSTSRPTVAYTPIASSILEPSPEKEILSSDIDADGLMDLAVLNKSTGRIEVLLNTGNNSFSAPLSINSPFSRSNDWKVAFAELNGDGLVDLIGFNQAIGKIAAMLNKSNSTVSFVDTPLRLNGAEMSAIKGNTSVRVVDLNGDGRLEFVALELNIKGVPGLSQLFTLNATKPGSFNEIIFESQEQLKLPLAAFNKVSTGIAQFEFVDLNADQISDFVIYDPISGTNLIVKLTSVFKSVNVLKRLNRYLLEVDTTFVNRIPTASMNGNAVVSFGQINHDDYVDVVTASSKEKAVYYVQNKGNFTFLSSFRSVADLPIASSADLQFYVGDVLGIGEMDDITLFTKDNSLTIQTEAVLWSRPENRKTTSLPSFFKVLNITGDKIRGHFKRDGGLDFLYYSRSGYNLIYDTKQNPFGNLLTKVVEGSGKNYDVQYSSLLDGSEVYTAQKFAYPIIELAAPLPLVSSLIVSIGSDKRESKFSYTGAGVHIDRGFLGFARTIEKNEATGLVTRYDFVVDESSWQLSENLRRVEITTLAGQRLSLSLHSYKTIGYPAQNPKIFGSYKQTSTVQAYSLDEKISKYRKQTVHSADNWLNPLISTVSYNTSGSNCDSIISSYAIDTGKWLLNRPASIGLYLKNSAQSEISFRASKFEYAENSGSLLRQTSFANLPENQRLSQSFIRDPMGNIIQQLQVGWDGYSSSERNSFMGYSPDGRFVVQNTNAQGHATSFKIDPFYGLPTSVTDANGLTTITTLDDFGRNTFTKQPDNQWLQTAYLEPDKAIFPQCPENTVYVVAKYTSNASPTFDFYDGWDRLIRSQKVSINGQTLLVDLKYDQRNNVIAQSLPYFVGTPPIWINYDFNEANQKVKTIFADNRSVSIAYSGFSITETNPKGQTTTRTTNVRGHLEREVNNKEVTEIIVSCDGKVQKITDPAGMVVLEREYDGRGELIKQKHCDRGTESYAVNAFGEVVAIQNAKNEIRNFKFDKIGRIAVEQRPEGGIIYSYDTGTKAVGKLVAVQGVDFRKQFSYDGVSRLANKTLTVKNKTLTVSFTYGNDGRIARKTFPNATALNYSYSNSGELTKITNAADGKPIWQLSQVNHLGQTLTETLGDKITVTNTYNPVTGWMLGTKATSLQTILQNWAFKWDANAQLITRAESVANEVEDITYDDFNRITSYQVRGEQSVTLSYNSSGQITQKSDVGVYKYIPGSHKLASITPVASNDRVCVPSLNISMSHFSFGRVKEIKNDTLTYQFAYNEGKERLFQDVYKSGRLMSTTVFFDDYEEKITNGNTISQAFVMVDGAAKAALIKAASNPVTIQFLLRDHLSSITAVTDVNGNLISRMAYDPFGSPRDANEWRPISNPQNTFGYGFTGHLSLSDLGLIHAGARIFDPLLGLFRSSDEVIENFTATGLNAYSYCLFSPLSRTDPTGLFSLGGFFEDLFDGIKNILKPKNFISTAISFASSVFLPPGISGFVSGVMSSLLRGGSLGESLKAGIRGGLFSYVSANVAGGVAEKFGHGFSLSGVVAHSVTQGAVSVAFGGDFLTGALSAGVTKSFSPWIDRIADPLLRVATAGVIGGVSSSVSGGDFTQGLLQAVMVRLHNDELCDWSKELGVLGKGMVWEGELNGAFDVFGKGLPMPIQASLDVNSFFIKMAVYDDLSQGCRAQFWIDSACTAGSYAVGGAATFYSGGNIYVGGGASYLFGKTCDIGGQFIYNLSKK